MKYVLSSYLDKYIFITTYEFRFKLIILGVLAPKLWACPVLPSYTPAASSAARGLPHAQVVTLAPLSKLRQHPTTNSCPSGPGVSILQMDWHRKRPAQGLEAGAGLLGKAFFSPRWSRGSRAGSAWAAAGEGPRGPFKAKVQGRGHLLGQVQG